MPSIGLSYGLMTCFAQCRINLDFVNLLDSYIGCLSKTSSPLAFIDRLGVMLSLIPVYKQNTVKKVIIFVWFIFHMFLCLIR